jgi:hypothetical protein
MQAHTLNSDCFCLELDTADVSRRALTAAHPVFLPASMRAEIVALVTEIDAALDQMRTVSPATRAAAVFNSFDFHMTAPDADQAGGPKLIEINVNAGGAFLQPEIARLAQQSRLGSALGGRMEAAFAPALVLIDTWRHTRARHAHTHRPPRMAIVDADIAHQPLRADMQAAQMQLGARGVPCEIVDLADLQIEDGQLIGPEGVIDMVYNRHCDFDLTRPESAVLRQAHADGLALVAPNPDVFEAWGDKDWLLELSALQDRPAAILAANELTKDSAPALWAQRKSLVFKPLSGFGSQGVYRGDKISRTRFEALVDAGYLAQEKAEPMTRIQPVDGQRRRFKSDIRVWTQGGKVLHMAARLYAGQVMGMRAKHEGFAPIIWLKDDDNACC